MFHNFIRRVFNTGNTLSIFDSKKSFLLVVFTFHGWMDHKSPMIVENLHTQNESRRLSCIYPIFRLNVVLYPSQIFFNPSKKMILNNLSKEISGALSEDTATYTSKMKRTDARIRLVWEKKREKRREELLLLIEMYVCQPKYMILIDVRLESFH